LRHNPNKLTTAWQQLRLPNEFDLSPLGLRPVASHNPAYERFLAYAIVGILFGLAYRGRAFMALVIVIGAAIALEGLQHLTPDRHGRLVDLLEKASGGLLGVLIAVAVSRYLAALSARSPTTGAR
jgi:VanZ family protein